MNVFPGITLHWLDLALVVFMLWVGVEGWFRGWKGSAWRLGMLGAAILIAALWRKELQSVPAFRCPVEEALRAAAFSRLVLPVSVLSGESVQPWLTALQEWLLLGPEVAVNVLLPPVDYLARALFNTAAFGLSLLVWGGALHLAGALLLDRGTVPSTGLSRLAGFMAGVARGAVLVVLAIGLAVPFLLLGPAAWEWAAFDQARLFQVCMHLFNTSGIWWH